MQDLETKAVLKACIQARAALAELKALGSLIPNQSILINSIPSLEAQASSEIENIVTTGDDLFRFAAAKTDVGMDPAVKETLRYRAALWEGYTSLAQRPLGLRTAIEVCSRVKGIDMNFRQTPGTTLVNDRTGAVIYTPPVQALALKQLLSNWEHWLHDSKGVDPLIAMAVQHYQFEAIHPFTDGNGRTGRVLNLLYLVHAGLLDVPVLYLSGAIIRRKADYYRLILEVTANAGWEAWIPFMLEAITRTAKWTAGRILAIKELLDATVEQMRLEAPRIYSRELAELVFAQPYSRIGNLVDAGIAQRQTAATHLKVLTSLGLLKEHRAGREVIAVNPALVKLLSAVEGLEA